MVTRVARNTPVSACQRILEIGPVTVPPTADLLEVVRISAAHPATRTIGVVDGDGRLIGVLRVLRLSESIVARVAPEALLADIRDAEAVGRFTHAVEDQVAGDIMEPPATITPEATVGEAFRLMHRHRVTGLYVIDPEGRPTGYLDLLELAMLYADAIESEREPTAGGSPTESSRAR